MSLRLLTHKVRVNGVVVKGCGSPVFVTATAGKMPEVRAFDDSETHSTIFVNGTTDVTTDTDGLVVSVTAGKRQLL